MGEPAEKIEGVQTKVSFVCADIDPAVMLRPQSWQVIIAPVKAEERTEGGLYLPGETIKAKDYHTRVGKVVAIGSLAFKGPSYQTRDGSKPIAKLGDWVLYRPFDGLSETMIDKNGDPATLKIINDDEIQAVVPDPAYLVDKV